VKELIASVMAGVACVFVLYVFDINLNIFMVRNCAATDDIQTVRRWTLRKHALISDTRPKRRYICPGGQERWSTYRADR
jgi:hypothetical protein